MGVADPSQTAETSPCVQVWTNGIQASCGLSSLLLSSSTSSPSCYFNYLTAVTPNVTAVYPTPGFTVLADDVITLVGSNFSPGIQGNSVHLVVAGDDYSHDLPVSCNVTSGNVTVVTWAVPNVPTGAYTWELFVSGAGYAVVSPTPGLNSITVGLAVRTVSPTLASACGGDIITLSGSGFPSTGVQVGQPSRW